MENQENNVKRKIEINSPNESLNRENYRFERCSLEQIEEIVNYFKRNHVENNVALKEKNFLIFYFLVESFFHMLKENRKEQNNISLPDSRLTNFLRNDLVEILRTFLNCKENSFKRNDSVKLFKLIFKEWREFYVSEYPRDKQAIELHNFFCIFIENVFDKKMFFSKKNFTDQDIRNNITIALIKKTYIKDKLNKIFIEKGKDNQDFNNWKSNLAMGDIIDFRISEHENKSLRKNKVSLWMKGQIIDIIKPEKFSGKFFIIC